MVISGASDSDNMLDEIFELNSHENMDIFSLSVANAPVVVIDNLYRKPELVRKFALSLSFHHKAGYYPGGYAFISYQSRKLLGLCNYVLRDKLERKITFNPGYKDTAFGQIWTPAEELIPVQKQPHYDYFSDYGGVVYLNPQDDGSSGTSFWRHVKTGLEAAPRIKNDFAEVDEALLQKCFDLMYVQSIEELGNSFFTHELENVAPGYPVADTDSWQVSHEIASKFNRFILFYGRAFHSAIIRTPPVGHQDKFSLRLTQNMFFDFR